MAKIFVIFKREYKDGVFKKSFIISTILMPIFLLVVVFIPALLSTVDVEENIDLMVVDYFGFVGSR